MKRKIISLLLAACMLVGLVPIHAQASDDGEKYGDLYYTISDGQVTITRCVYDISTEDIVIPSEIAGYPVTKIGENAFYKTDKMKSIVIPDTVINIEKDAFYDCDNLSSIKIPDSVKSIGDYAFAYCNTLSEISIPDSVTEIGTCIFKYSSLTSFDFPKTWTTIPEGFLSYCSSLVSVNFNNITVIGAAAFEGCSSLDIQIPEKVLSIGNAAFSECTSITNIKIPYGVTEIPSGSFRNCTNLQTIEIPDSVTEIGSYAFWLCKELNNISIPDSVSQIGGAAFAQCTSLTSVVLPHNLTKLGAALFSNCTNLTSVSIPVSVTFFDNHVFDSCTNLKDIYYGGTEEQWKNIPYSGNGKPTVTIHYNSYPDENNQDTTFIQQHLSFSNSDTYNLLLDSSWSAQIKNGLDDTASMTAEAIYNVLNSGSELFKCKTLSIFDNPYDAIIADLILSQINSKQEDFEINYKNTLLECLDNLASLCKAADPQNEYGTSAKDFKTSLEELIESPKDMKAENPNFYAAMEKVFTTLKQQDSLDTYLNAYQIGSSITEALDKYNTAVEWVVYCIQFYSTVTAYLETSQAFKENLALMYGYMANTYDTTQQAYAELFLTSWNKYDQFDKDNLSNKQVAEMLLQEFSWDGSKKIIDVFGSDVLKVAQKWVVSATGLSAAELTSTTLGKAFAAIEAYKAGWWFSETITKNGDIVDCRELIRAIYYLAKSSHETLEYRENNLQKYQDYASAELFDSAWGILKNCEEYSLSTYKEYLEKNNSVWYKALLNKLKHNNTASEIENITEWIALWENASCHSPIISSSYKNSRIKTITVCCPTDVFVYDMDGNVVASVENNTVTYRDYGIAVEVAGDAKVISLLNPENYDIKINATDNGTMSITETISTLSDGFYSQVKYQDVKIQKGKQYSIHDDSSYESGTLTDGTTELSPSSVTKDPEKTTLTKEPSPFLDVQNHNEYYYTPVLWAALNGITAGTDTTHFSPNQSCTRAQLVSFLWRAAGEPEPETTKSPFTDVQNPNEYYYKAVLWAAENGIAAGVGNNQFAPNQTCTRAQIVSFIYRASGDTETYTENPFTDVSPKDYYYKAVLWGAANGVVAGTSDTTFSPDETCTRAQGVSFLYRSNGLY